MILIVTAPTDAHADHVAALLEARGAPFVRFDPADLPVAAGISIEYARSGAGNHVLVTERERVDLSDVTAAWYRRPGTPAPHPDLRETAAREFVELECGMVLQDLWNSLDCPWLPGPPLMVRRAEYKSLGLTAAGRLGFELPPTLTTNRRADVLEFYRQHDGRIISKLAATAFPATIGFSMIRFTELVTPRDIAHAAAIAHCPMTFQAYVPKRVELRITVVDDRAFAAEIHSQASNHTRFDWRRYDLDRTPHRPHALPREVERRCIQLVAALGLRYGAIDMIVTPDDRYVFLEINPNGQYLWIEHQTGLPISDAICDALTDPPPSGARA